MRRPLFAAGIPMLLGLVACAGGVSTADVEAVAPQPDSAPLEWFVENWGPFDPANVGVEGSRYLPLLLVDGKQVYRQSLTEVEGRAVMPTEDEIRHVHVVKGHSGAGLFGEAACGGVIMLFTHDYEGPMPIAPRLDNPPDCRRGRP